jgi:hypothetical protein
MMEAARTSERMVNSYQRTRRHNPEDSNLPKWVCFLSEENPLNGSQDLADKRVLQKQLFWTLCTRCVKSMGCVFRVAGGGTNTLPAAPKILWHWVKPCIFMLNMNNLELKDISYSIVHTT